MTHKQKIILATLAIFSAGLVIVTFRGSGEAAPQGDVAVDHISHAHGIAVDLADPNRVYIATHHGLLVLVNDKDLFQVGSDENDLMGFSVDPKNPQVFYRSGHPKRGGNLGFQISEDRGLTWRTVSEGIDGPVDFHALAVSPADPRVIYGWYRTLQRSEDGGKTWAVANREIQAFALVPHPQDPARLYAITRNGVMASGDKGATWKEVPWTETKQAVALAYSPRDHRRVIASVPGKGVYAFSDEGKTWNRSSEAFGGDVVSYLAYGHTDLVVYALTAKNALYRSDDGGMSWTKLR